MYERYPEKELKQEAYAIFFKSLDDILEMIGIGNRKIILHLTWHERIRTIMSYDIVHEVEQLPEGEDFKHELNWYYLKFTYKGKRYLLGISSRIGTIVNFLVTKGIFEPFMEAARRYKHNPIPTTDEHGTTWHEMDLTDHIRYWGTGIGRDLESMKKRIWSPKIEPLYHDEPEGVRRIGDPYNK